jgi:peroxin-3
LQSHFESIQRISDTTTLPSVLPHLKASLFSKVDISVLTDKLMLGKEEPQLLSQEDKVQLWHELKTLSESQPFHSVVIKL